MPYFPAHEALFVHIPKCAGKSIENAFLPDHLDATSGARGPANSAARWALKKTASPVPETYLLGTLDVALAAQHLTYVEIEMLGLLTKDQLERATKFCVVRDPFTRAISSVLHFSQRFSQHYTLSNRPDAAEIERALSFWIDIEPDDHNVRAHRRTQSSFVLDSRGENRMDHILRLENLNDDFARLREALNVGEAVLPWTGKSHVSKDYSSLYNASSRDLVRKAFAEDFDRFGYQASV
ncbi:sulfotransferase family 2 domain-containing protein [Aurantiacibacter sediminis]|uniref:Sulfotransferase family 2 domain-containing protein n=1 Tax=Aurantiacibacter sediminis TaxID=2793064 RepID=A0ABS0N395_9SPHN|nr:sulfotransferase family 2 domain-containing protein [Aurantiacibacter sediminis]MBH5322440.1 sulfotransferase family 2 domain-containing protein [Aurantiacibacter sediminis]